MVWRRSSVPGVRIFAVMMVAAAFWAFMRLLEAGVNETWAKIFWGKTEYLGIVVVSPAWLFFTIYYTRRNKSFHRRYIILLSAIPFITLLMAWTNEYHALIWSRITPTSNPEVLNYEHGTWFWIAVIYNYVLLLSGIGVLVNALIYAPKQYRSQAIALILGSAAPIAGNVLYVIGLSPIKGMDITPFCFTATSVIYFFTVFRSHLFDIRHVARATIIENMRDGVLILDEKYRVIDVNPSALHILGASRALIGSDIRATLSKHAALFTAVVSQRHDHLTVNMGDETARYIDVQASEILDAQDNAVGKTVILRDVTQHRIKEQRAFETAIEQQRIQLLSQFIRDVSHEFRTPLSVINNSLYLMGKSSDAQQQSKRREIIQLQTQRLDYLISEMLTTVQLDADAAFDHAALDVNVLLQTIGQEQLSSFAAKQQHLVLQTSDAPLHLSGNDYMLQKALTNIVQNANRYTPQGGTITVSVKEQDNFIIIAINDTGLGISRENQARIFERFFRVDDAHSTPGFGLGLPIAQSIIEKHQGWMDVESTPGTGTTFTIHLPLKRDEIISQPVLQLATT